MHPSMLCAHRIDILLPLVLCLEFHIYSNLENFYYQMIPIVNKSCKTLVRKFSGAATSERSVNVYK